MAKIQSNDRFGIKNAETLNICNDNSYYGTYNNIHSAYRRRSIEGFFLPLHLQNFT